MDDELFDDDVLDDNDEYIDAEIIEEPPMKENANAGTGIQIHRQPVLQPKKVKRVSKLKKLPRRFVKRGIHCIIIQHTNGKLVKYCNN